jgi:N-acyl-D-amino-acid deacylase
MEAFIRCPYVAFCSDGITLDSQTVVHPRTTGSFTKALREFVRETPLLTLSEAVRKMTSLTCQSIGIRNKGLIRLGYDADLVLFDPDRVTDRSDNQSPGRLSEGIASVIVNGKVAFTQQRLTGQANGKVLKKQSPRQEGSR